MRLFIRRTPTHDTDVLFLHIDDRATIRYEYLNEELRESLLFHLLYVDRVLVPINFLLSNMNIGDLFQYGGKVSEQSDIYKLIRSGAIVPTLFRSDYGSIGDYARYALEEERILLPCPTDQWLRRADLLDEFGYAAPREGFRSAYKETVVRLLQDETLQGIYFVRCLTQGRDYVRRMVDQLGSKEGVTRSDVYRLTQQSPSEKVRLAAEQIADAAYYVTFSDIFKAKVAVSSIYYPALLVHYCHTEPERRPLVFTPAIEEEIIEASIPNSGPLSLAEAFNDLKDSSLRKNWLSTLRKKMREGRVDFTDSEVLASLVPWTRFVLHYLSLPSSLQRKDAVRIPASRTASNARPSVWQKCYALSQCRICRLGCCSWQTTNYEYGIRLRFNYSRDSAPQSRSQFQEAVAVIRLRHSSFQSVVYPQGKAPRRVRNICIIRGR